MLHLLFRHFCLHKSFEISSHTRKFVLEVIFFSYFLQALLCWEMIAFKYYLIRFFIYLCLMFTVVTKVIKKQTVYHHGISFGEREILYRGSIWTSEIMSEDKRFYEGNKTGIVTETKEELFSWTLILLILHAFITQETLEILLDSFQASFSV